MLIAQDILKDVEQSYYAKITNKDEAEKKFDAWLRNQGFLDDSIEKEKKSNIENKEQISFEVIEELNSSRKSQQDLNSIDRDKSAKQNTITISQEKNNNNKWMYTKHPPESKYITNLNDFYPRDPYTLMPDKTALLSPFMNKELRGMTLSQVKNFMKKNYRIKSALTAQNELNDRLVYFKPKSVTDLQTKSKRAFQEQNIFDLAGLHLCNDLGSFQYEGPKQFLNKKKSSYGNFYDTVETIKTIKSQLS
jgi:hypothetical protein